jgi:hypothetical protein
LNSFDEEILQVYEDEETTTVLVVKNPLTATTRLGAFTIRSGARNVE